ncbi:MAG: hypothetical protein R2876_04300 [Eubacteriales bacterium]
MKRILSTLLYLIFIIVLCGCNSNSIHRLSQEQIREMFPDDFEEDEDVYAKMEEFWDSYSGGYTHAKELEDEEISKEVKEGVNQLEELSKKEGNKTYSEDSDIIKNVIRIHRSVENLQIATMSIPDVKYLIDMGIAVENATKIGDFYFVFYNTEVRKYAYVFHKTGYIVAMCNLNKTPLNKADFEKLEVGMSVDEVKKIDPSTIVIGESQHFFDDGDVITIDYEEEEGELLITRIDYNEYDKYYMFFAGPDIIYHTRNS